MAFLNLHMDSCMLRSSHGKENAHSHASSLSNTDAACSVDETDDCGGSKKVKHTGNVEESTNNDQFNVGKLVIERNKKVDGLYMIYNFISEEEEALLLDQIYKDEQNPFRRSDFNGHCNSKKYGVVTIQSPMYGETRNVRENDMTKGEWPLPAYLKQFLLPRLKQLSLHRTTELPELFKEWTPNECNINEYVQQFGHYLTPHFDDRQLSGPILANLSLHGNCSFTYRNSPNNELEVVFVPRFSLQLVTGDSRYKYTHEINKEHIYDEKRVSITLRYASNPSLNKAGITQIPQATSTIDQYLRK